MEEGEGLTLKKTLEIANSCEKVESQLHQISNEKVETVSRIRQSNKFEKEKTVEKNTKTRKGINSRAKGRESVICYRCGRSGHMGKDPNCPARDQICRKCKGKNHFEVMCKTKNRLHHVTEHQVTELEPEGDEDIDRYAFHVT